MTQKDSDSPRRRNCLSFRLRTLLLLMLVVAAFCGGWVANEARHRYVIEDDVTIELLTDTDMVIMRGTQGDVERVSSEIKKSIDEASP